MKRRRVDGREGGILVRAAWTAGSGPDAFVAGLVEPFADRRRAGGLAAACGLYMDLALAGQDRRTISCCLSS
jgi:hypothetical protein